MDGKKINDFIKGLLKEEYPEKTEIKERFVLNNDDVYNHKVNARQTLRDQQKQGRRPRFSIFSKIPVIIDNSPIIAKSTTPAKNKTIKLVKIS